MIILVLVYFLTIALPIIIWSVIINLLSKWKKLVLFLVINVLIALIYVLVLNYGTSIWGHDEYGLGFLLRVIVFILCHAIIALGFSILKYRQLNKY